MADGIVDGAKAYGTNDAAAARANTVGMVDVGSSVKGAKTADTSCGTYAAYCSHRRTCATSSYPGKRSAAIHLLPRGLVLQEEVGVPLSCVQCFPQVLNVLLETHFATDVGVMHSLPAYWVDRQPSGRAQIAPGSDSFP
jgi:hypothetical protein